MTTIDRTTVPAFEMAQLRGDDGGDFYRMLAEARGAGPVLKADVPITWVLPRHEHVSSLLRDRRVSHVLPRPVLEFMFGEGPAADFQENSLLNRDPPDHTRLRTLMGQAFSASLVRKMREHITELTDQLLEPALDRATFDLVEELAYPLPSMVICELLGIEMADRDMVRDKAALATSAERDEVNEGIGWFRDYMAGVLADRVADPDGDLLQRMLAAEDGDDSLTHDEIVDNALLLFAAGFETTRNLIATGCVLLNEHPDQKERLWADPGLSTTAVEEFLRFDGPVPFLQRMTVEPMEIAGTTIKPGRVLLLLLASANHDERFFENPEALDIGRSPNPHVAFGGGIHHCLGAQLARVEGDVVFKRLAERLRTFEAAGEPERRPSANLRAYARVPVVATAR